jgi:hypothetical protein
MLERPIQAVATYDAGAEAPALTRDRLKGRFPPGSTRRMTQLGLLVGATLEDVPPGEADTLVYASSRGETRALEAYLDSFPGASPTLFQTSIHPSSIQQDLVARQRRVAEVFPLAGGDSLVAQALAVALVAPAARSLVCGGEERGTWLHDLGLSSDRSFAFALALARAEADPPARAIGRIRLERTGEGGGLGLGAWFDLLHGRQNFAGAVGAGWRLELSWC